MTPKIVLPDGDPHMTALLSRADFAARLDRLGGARLHADLPAARDCGITVANVAHYGDAAVAEYNTPESLERMLDVVVANIENYLSGAPANIVSPRN